jgi:antitoxin component of MazEF toxin-antitoxin module
VIQAGDAMSFDPFGYQPETPSAPQPSTDPVVAQTLVRERVIFPAVFLVGVGLINFTFALIQVWGFVVAVRTPAAQLKKMQLQPAEDLSEKLGDSDMGKQLAEATEKMRKTPAADLKQQSILYNGLISALLLVVAVIGMAGGFRMFQMRSWSTAMFGSVVTVLPCISCSGCCGLGQLVGFWSIWVLLSVDVRAAFR